MLKSGGESLKRNKIGTVTGYLSTTKGKKMGTLQGEAWQRATQPRDPGQHPQKWNTSTSRTFSKRHWETTSYIWYRRRQTRQRFPENENKIWVVSLTFSSFVLGLVPLAHRGSRAEASPAQTRLSDAKRLRPTPRFKTAAAGRAQNRCARHFAIRSVSGAAAPPPRAPPPPPTRPYKAAPPRRDGRARALEPQPFFAQRTSFPSASELSSVPFYWLQRHRAGDPCWGPTWVGR